MSPTFDVEERDRRLAWAINQEARNDPSSPYAGKFVAISGGKVVAADERLENVVAALKGVAPERGDGLIVEASADYEGPHEIWDV